MFWLSLAITILIGFFLPKWMYNTEWTTLIKIAMNDGDISTWKELKDALNISQQGAIEYICIMLGICLIIFIIIFNITKIINKAITNKKEK